MWRSQQYYQTTFLQQWTHQLYVWTENLPAPKANKPNLHGLSNKPESSTSFISSWSCGELCRGASNSAIYQQKEDHEFLALACTQLDQVVKDMFSQCSWQYGLRISKKKSLPMTLGVSFSLFF